MENSPMKKYYLFLIILLALKCSIIAQRVEPSRTYNLIEECYCTSFKQVEELYNGTIVYACTKCGKETMANPNGVGGTIEDIIEQNKREAKLAELMKNPSQASNAEAAKMLGTIVPSTITKQQEEAMGDLINQSIKNQEEIIKHYEEKHYCLSFNFVKESGVITKFLIYECTECGQQVQILPPDTIENKIADNKRIMELEKAAINALKKNQSIPNQQKPASASKPQKKSTPNATSYNNPGSPNYDPNKEWSGSEADLQELAKIMKEKFSDEAWSHFGRDVASLKPYSLEEVIYELRNGNPNNIYIELGDKYHQNDERSTFTKDGEAIVNIMEGVLVGAKYVANKTAEHNDTLLKKITGAVFGAAIGAVLGGVSAADTNTKIEGSEKILEYLEWMRTEGSISNVKIGLSGGREAVYSLNDGRIVKDKKLGTQNFGERGVVSSVFGNHEEKDIDPNNTKAIAGNQFTRDGDQYKYVGILYKRDENDPNKFYIINGQTGERMSAKQAYEFAATISDMYVDDSPYQSVIDPLDPQYREHLNYHKNQKKVFGK